MNLFKVHKKVQELAEHKEVEKCIAAIWRFRLKAKINEVLIETKFLNEDLRFDSYEPGEDLYSIGFETKNYNLHIGTQDKDSKIRLSKFYQTKNNPVWI